MKTPSLTGIAVAMMLAAQQPARVEFEAVSIKPADPAAPAHMAQATRGGFRGRNLRLFELVMGAWRLNREELVGSQGWMETAGWDIDARYPAGAGAAQGSQMMQAMLADRFRLVVHRETRTLQIYALSVAKGGLKLPPGVGQGTMSAGTRLIRYGSATMGQLAGQLSGYLGRNVIDQTGVTGQFAINRSFAPVDPGAPADASAPSIFQALQDQAGLKLDLAKGPVAVLVIDRAEKPTGN